MRGVGYRFRDESSDQRCGTGSDTSIKNRLTFLFFSITAGAILVIYFYVVPQLESNLTSQKVDALERDRPPTRARSRARSRAR